MRNPLNLPSLAAIILAPMILTACATGTVSSDVEPGPKTVSQPLTRNSNWTLRLPEVENVVYQGVVSLDSAGVNAGSMLYPAPNAAGFVAALITHGILNESIKNKQKTKLQEAADKVLLPYQPALDSFSYRELMQQGLEKVSIGGSKKLVGYSEIPAAGWFVESTPVFSMTQDQSAIIIDNLISVYDSGNRESAAYKIIVRVVSRAINETDLVHYWSADNGKRLKDESIRHFSESLDIALTDMFSTAKPNANSHKTIRYLEGKNEKMERAQLISEHCGRVVIKTLRGDFMSVPVRQDTAGSPADCGRLTSNLK